MSNLRCLKWPIEPMDVHTTWRIIPVSRWSFIIHEWPFGKGPTTLLRGRKRSPWLLTWEIQDRGTFTNPRWLIWAASTKPWHYIPLYWVVNDGILIMAYYKQRTGVLNCSSDKLMSMVFLFSHWIKPENISNKSPTMVREKLHWCGIGIISLHQRGYILERLIITTTSW